MTHSSQVIRSMSIPCACVAALCAAHVRADGPTLLMDCTRVDGGSMVAVPPGGAFTARVSTASASGVMLNSALLRVMLTRPGIVLENYQWAPPFQTGGFTDFSLLDLELPLAVEESTLSGPNYPVGISDVEFGNFLLAGDAPLGTLLTVSLRVPHDVPPGTEFLVIAVPDSLALGFTVYAAQPRFILTVRVVQRPDLSQDGLVNGADLGILLAAWGTPGADLNGDGTTDGADLGLLLSAWGTRG